MPNYNSGTWVDKIGPSCTEDESGVSRITEPYMKKLVLVVCNSVAM